MSKIDDLIAAYNAAYHSCHDDQHRAAIAAVAEWLDAYHKANYLQSENHASPALRSALEAKP